MDMIDWAGSNGTIHSEFDSEDSNDEELSYMPNCISKLHFRKDVSVARWNMAMGMAEVALKKGGMWTTIGMIRQSKHYCLIEEALFLAEKGAIILLDMDDGTLALKDIYGFVAEGVHGCSWDSFEAYRHLKSLGYVVGRHGLLWTARSDNTGVSSDSLQEDDIPCLLTDLRIGEQKPTFDVHLPNRRFRKSDPGEPSFVVFVARELPSRTQIETLERNSKGIPLKVCHVEHGRDLSSFFTPKYYFYHGIRQEGPKLWKF